MKRIHGDQKVLWTVFAAVLFRFVWLLFIHPSGVSSDATWYFEKACAMADGSGYSSNGAATAFYPVGYPAFLAILFFIFGKALWVGYLANLALSAFIFFFFFKITEILVKNPMVAVFSTLLLALWPNQLAYTSLLYSETLHLALFSGAIYFMIKSELVGKKSFLSLAAVLFALAVLVKPQTFFAPLLVLWALKANNLFKNISKPWKVIHLYAIVTMLIFPWTVRNYLVFHQFIPVSTNAGFDLLVGNHSGAKGNYNPDSVYFKNLPEASNEAEYSNSAKISALRYIGNNPNEFIRRLPWKTKFFFFKGAEGISLNIINMEGQIIPFLLKLRFVSVGLHYLLLFLNAVFWLFYLFFNGEKNPVFRLSIILTLYYLSISLVFFGESRFLFPVIPFYIATAVGYLSQVKGRARLFFSRPHGGTPQSHP